ncbi:MAG: polysaccharide export protein [Candidatus Hydrogenedentes bacterium]|nr:polysaccharide export protein [Candidatus Hydrogenedentota bacterium]
MSGFASRWVVVLALAVLWSAPDAVAFPWGKKNDASQDTLIAGVSADVVEERATIDIPAPSRPDVEVEANPEVLPTELPATEYTVGPGDVLSFQSFDDPSLSRESLVVLYDGTLSLPLIPDLEVAGLTRDELEEKIRQAYADGVFKEPQVSVSVRTAASKYYYVLGDILNASRYPYEHPLSVLAAINIAGGLRTSSRTDSQAVAASPGTLTKAFIIRDQQGQRQVIELDLSSLTDRGPHPSETLVMPGDFVYIPEGVNLVYVLGEVRNPNVFQLAEGQTLTQTLTRAGGPVESTGKLKNVILMRELDETHREVLVIDWREIMKTGNDIPLRPGDVVYVPRKGLVRLEEFVARVTGPISQVLGLYTQFYDAYYAEERNRILVEGTDTSDAVGILQNVRNFGELLQTFQNSGTPVPTP